MKAGVEDGDLRHRTQQFRDNLHAFQFGAIVERREDGNAFDRRLDLSGNERRLEMLRTAMNDAVSDNVDIGRAGNRLRIAAPQAIEQALDRFSTRTRRSHVLSARLHQSSGSKIAPAHRPIQSSPPNSQREDPPEAYLQFHKDNSSGCSIRN